MRPHRTAAILSIGDELVLGQNLDTSSRDLADRLLSRGILPVEHVTIPDDAAAHRATLDRLSASADLIISTGGLGPTPDDLTRHALAAAMGDALVEDETALNQIRSWFVSRGREMPESNRVQALRPSRATSLPNAHGTAPGLHGVLPNGVDVFCLPGPPREMLPMFELEVAPRLRPPPGRLILTRSLHCVGLGESDIAQRLGDLMLRDRSPTVGTTASGGIVTCRVRLETDADTPAAARTIDEACARIRSILGPAIFGEGSETLPEVVLELLRRRSFTLAFVESCTGGLLGQMLTAIPGASDVIAGGWVTYSNAMKESCVAVPRDILDRHGAVSRECAVAMAVGGRNASGASVSISITGIAGPDGGTPSKPVGTVWIALADARGTDVRRFQFGGDRSAVRNWAAISALAMLLHRLRGDTTILVGQVPSHD